MKLDRNITNPRRGKYALIKLRTAVIHTPDALRGTTEVTTAAIDYGNYDDDFFVIRLKDKYAAPALRAYAEAARVDDAEYAEEIIQLAVNAETHPIKRKPD